jgi:hypothetical protein
VSDVDAPAFVVELSQFTGPLDLLLSLIRESRSTLRFRRALAASSWRASELKLNEPPSISRWRRA